MQTEYFIAYQLNDTATVTVILLPAISYRDWVRYQESSDLDIMLFAPPPRSNFQDSYSKRACLLQ
jgi:hypothetical protein